MRRETEKEKEIRVQFGAFCSERIYYSSFVATYSSDFVAFLKYIYFRTLTIKQYSSKIEMKTIERALQIT